MSRKIDPDTGDTIRAEPSDLPADAIQALQAISAPVEQILEAHRVAGVPRDITMGVIQRLAAQQAGFRHSLKALSVKHVIGSLEQKIALVLHYLDECAISTAKPRDLAIILGILIDKRQLLLGEPTQILSMQERKHVNDLIPVLLQEAEARGMTIDLSPAGYEEIDKDGRAVRVHAKTKPTPERPVAKRKMLARKD